MKRAFPVLLAVVLLLFALPFLAAIAFAVIRFGPRLLEIINVAIKGAVVS